MQSPAPRHIAAKLRNHQQLHFVGVPGVTERLAALASLRQDGLLCGLGQRQMLPPALTRVVSASQYAVAQRSSRIHIMAYAAAGRVVENTGKDEAG